MHKHVQKKPELRPSSRFLHGIKSQSTLYTAALVYAPIGQFSFVKCGHVS